jgi:hypothetical protein
MKTADALRLFFINHTDKVSVKVGLTFIAKLIFFLLFLLLKKRVISEYEVDDMINTWDD